MARLRARLAATDHAIAERRLKPGQLVIVDESSLAGTFALDAPAAAGVYKVTLSAGGWIDVVQDGKFLKAVAFSEATGCANARKRVKFRIAAEPAVLSISALSDCRCGCAACFWLP